MKQHKVLRMALMCTAGLWLGGLLMGAQWYVSPTGQDSSSGHSPLAPFGTIQHAVDLASVGDTIVLRGGVYREFVDLREVEPRGELSLTICAYSNETPVLTGSEVVENWTWETGYVWTVTNWTEQPQQVFDDGVSLKQVGWPNILMASNTVNLYRIFGTNRQDMTNGTFYYATNDYALYVWLADDSAPTSSLMEVSKRFLILHQRPQDEARIHVRGLTFRHSNVMTYKENGWYAVSLGKKSRIEDCTFDRCDFSALSVGSGAIVSNCTLSRNGCTGMGWNETTNVLVIGCTVSSNNTRGFVETWHAGGIKTIPNSGGRVERCEVSWNWGDGIWFDACRSGAPIEIVGNYVHNNRAFPHPTITKPGRQGIFIEISKNVLVCNNILERNEAGLLVSGSDNVRVVNNTISESTMRVGAQMYLERRYLKPFEEWATLTSNRLCNNVFYNNQSLWDLSLQAENSSVSNYIMDIISDHNCFYRTNGTVALRRNSTVWHSLSQWSADTGWDSNSIVTDPSFVVGP